MFSVQFQKFQFQYLFIYLQPLQPFSSAVKDVLDQTYANKFTLLHKVHSCSKTVAV